MMAVAVNPAGPASQLWSTPTKQAASLVLTYMETISKDYFFRTINMEIFTLD